MIEKIKVTPRKSTINKLADALLEMDEENGAPFIPENHPEWYKKTGITKKTFCQSICSYQDYIPLFKESLLKDLEDFLKWLKDIKTLEEGVKWLMTYSVAVPKDAVGSKSRNKQSRNMKMAAYHCDTDYWVEILSLFRPQIEKSFLLKMDKAVMAELLELWAGDVRMYFKMWANHGMSEGWKKSIYDGIMSSYKRLVEDWKTLGLLVKTRPKD